MIKAGSRDQAFRPLDDLAPRDFLAYVRRMRRSGYDSYVGLAEGQIAGYVDFQKGTGGVGLILGIYVKPAYRGKGCASELLKKATGMLAHSRCHKIRTEVYSGNLRARRFWLKNHFTMEAHLPNDEFHRDVEIWSYFP
jgi:RimJ/RimL family protein N-acetyltransferase